MSSASPMFEVGSEVLGYVGTTASWRRPATKEATRWGPMLVISTSAGTDEGVHEPAASITLTSREAMLSLRAAIDEALKEVGAA